MALPIDLAPNCTTVYNAFKAAVAVVPAIFDLLAAADLNTTYSHNYCLLLL